MNQLTVIKVGGAELAEGSALDELVAALVRLAAGGSLLIVHGGGPEIAALQQRLGIEPQFIEGLRVTDESSLRVAEMVLSGLINKRLTGRLVARGVRALGLSGVDAGLLCARPLQHPKGDLGRVGEIVKVDADCLRQLLAAGFVPVLSPISLGPEGKSLNVNADHAALAVAGTLQAAELIFLTDVPGVLRDGQMLASLDAAEARGLIAGGIVTGGMVPKVRSALDAIDAGVQSARITNLAGLARGDGTRVLGARSAAAGH